MKAREEHSWEIQGLLPIWLDSNFRLQVVSPLVGDPVSEMNEPRGFQL